jgi:hypothetical protein
MRILIVIGMIIIFISAFFMFLTGDAVFSSAFECAEEGGELVCRYVGMSGSHTIGLILIAFFLLIDIATVYIIVTNVKNADSL